MYILDGVVVTSVQNVSEQCTRYTKICYISDKCYNYRNQ